MRRAIGFAILCAMSAAAGAQLAPNAPPDQPIGIRDQRERIEMAKAVAPHIALARETYPRARERYLSGLPTGHTFFVTTELRDQAGRTEQVFIQVTRIEPGIITGKIASDIRLVGGYQAGQEHVFPEFAILDWLISKPDGTEEGNFVGKFLDSLQR